MSFQDRRAAHVERERVFVVRRRRHSPPAPGRRICAQEWRLKTPMLMPSKWCLLLALFGAMPQKGSLHFKEIIS